MAMLLTDRNLSICFSCNVCVEGGGCRYIRQGVKIKFSNPLYIRDKKSGRQLSLGRKPRWIKRPEDIKFINPVKRIQKKTQDKIIAGEIIRPDRCERCGKIGPVDAHHPDYNLPDFVFFLCRPCHIQERPEKAVSIIELSFKAKERRLLIIEKKWGKQIKDIIVDFHNQPELKAVDLAELMGISRERVRQFLIEIHGRGNSPKLTKRCVPLKSRVPLVIKTLERLHDCGFTHITVNLKKHLYRLENGAIVCIKKLSSCKTTQGARCSSRPGLKLDFIIGYYENDFYIVPINKVGKTAYYVKKREFPLYKDAWYLLNR